MNFPSFGWRALALACVVTTLAAVPPAVWSQAKPRIEKAADLPRFTYKIDGKVEELVRNADRFAPFAAALRKDLEGVLERYDIPDKNTQRELLTTLALLDFLDGRFDAAHAKAEQVRALQDKPADKLISGLRLRAAARSAQAHGGASVGSSRVDLQACKLEYSIVSPK